MRAGDTDRALTFHGQGLGFNPQFQKDKPKQKKPKKNQTNKKKMCTGPKHPRPLGYDQEPKLKTHRVGRAAEVQTKDIKNLFKETTTDYFPM